MAYLAPRYANVAPAGGRYPPGFWPPGHLGATAAPGSGRPSVGGSTAGEEEDEEASESVLEKHVHPRAGTSNGPMALCKRHVTMCRGTSNGPIVPETCAIVQGDQQWAHIVSDMFKRDQQWAHG